MRALAGNLSRVTWRFVTTLQFYMNPNPFLSEHGVFRMHASESRLEIGQCA